MNLDFDIKHWSNPCPKYDCRKNSCKCGLMYVNIPASIGDDSADSEVAPRNGAYCNAIVEYEANGSVYVYSKEGIPVFVEGKQPVVRISMVNPTSATWVPAGKEGESSQYGIYDRGSAMSQDVTFKREDGPIMDVKELYDAIASGEKFILDIPFGDVNDVAGVWDYPLNLGTAKNVLLSTQENQTSVYWEPEETALFYTSSAVVMPLDFGQLVPYTLPIGVGRLNGDYVFIISLLGYDPN